MKFAYYCKELLPTTDKEEIDEQLKFISRRGDKLISVAIHPTTKTIMLFIKTDSPYPSQK